MPESGFHEDFAWFVKQIVGAFSDPAALFADQGRVVDAQGLFGDARERDRGFRPRAVCDHEVRSAISWSGGDGSDFELAPFARREGQAEAFVRDDPEVAGLFAR